MITNHKNDVKLFEITPCWGVLFQLSVDSLRSRVSSLRPPYIKLINLGLAISKLLQIKSRVIFLRTMVSLHRPRVSALGPRFGFLRPRVGTLRPRVSSLTKNKPRVSVLRPRFGFLRARAGSNNSIISVLQSNRNDKLYIRLYIYNLSLT